eukprot:g1750.t1
MDTERLKRLLPFVAYQWKDGREVPHATEDVAFQRAPVYRWQLYQLEHIEDEYIQSLLEGVHPDHGCDAKSGFLGVLHEVILDRLKVKAAETGIASAAEREFSPAPVETETPAGGRIQMPAHGMASGRHGMIFQRPKSLSYTSSGGYVTEARAVASSVTSTQNEGGQRAGDGDWVEWSATGLKDASIFDLSPTGTSTQIRDKLLPFIRCASRLKQLRTMFTVFHQFHPGLEPETPQKPPVQDTDDPKAKRIYLDAAAFGAGSCCTQATMLCPSLSDARYLYDQLLVLAPLFLPLCGAQ